MSTVQVQTWLSFSWWTHSDSIPINKSRLQMFRQLNSSLSALFLHRQRQTAVAMVTDRCCSQGAAGPFTCFVFFPLRVEFAEVRLLGSALICLVQLEFSRRRSGSSSLVPLKLWEQPVNSSIVARRSVFSPLQEQMCLLHTMWKRHFTSTAPCLIPTLLQMLSLLHPGQVWVSLLKLYTENISSSLQESHQLASVTVGMESQITEGQKVNA